MIAIVSILVAVILILAVYIAYLKKKMSFQVKRKIEEKEENIRKEAVDKSRAILKGKISEHLAPHFKEFDFEASDARFLGSPVDYVIFDGYSQAQADEDGKLKIVFSDVKKGDSASLTPAQRKVKEAVEEKRVEWETIRLD